jgi:hypothetical protein
MQSVKVWEFNNTAGHYKNMAPTWVTCVQLEQDGDPIDFILLFNLKDFLGDEFLDVNGNRCPWELAMPDRLPDMMQLLGCEFLNPNLTRVPKMSDLSI